MGKFGLVKSLIFEGAVVPWCNPLNLLLETAEFAVMRNGLDTWPGQQSRNCARMRENS